MECVACFGVHDEARSLGRRSPIGQSSFHLINRVKGYPLIFSAVQAEHRRLQAGGTVDGVFRGQFAGLADQPALLVSPPLALA